MSLPKQAVLGLESRRVRSAGRYRRCGHRLRAARLLALVAGAFAIVGCGNGLLRPPEPRARLDPPPGTYVERINVSPRDDERYYWSPDPQARLADFVPMESELTLDDDFTFRYFAVSDEGVRSPIIRAVYVIEDAEPPRVRFPEIRLSGVGYTWFELRWDTEAFDSVSLGRNLEYAVFSSESRDIGSITAAEANGRLEAGWTKGMASYVHRAPRPGSGRFFNVFVRDREGNAAGFGTRRFTTRPALSVYVGQEQPTVDDSLYLLDPSSGYTPFYPVTSTFAFGTTLAVELARIDGDAFEDLAIVHGDGTTDSYRWFRVEPDATFDAGNPQATVHTEPASTRSRTIVVVDVVGDGAPELVYNTGVGDIRLSSAEGTLLGELAADADRFVVGDVNGDDRPDIVSLTATPDSESVRVWRNDGGGVFAPVAQPWTLPPDPPSDLLLADLDNDGRLDLVLVIPLAPNGGPNVELYYGSGDATFAETTGESTFWPTDGATEGVAVGDFNRDGWPDLFFSNAIPPSQIYVNNGDRSFAAGSSTNSVSQALGAFVADVNGDGFADVVEDHTADLQVWIGNGWGFDTAPITFASGWPRHVAVGQVR